MCKKHQHAVFVVFLGIFFLLCASAPTLAITRDEVISNAERYANHKWRVLPGNAKGKFNRLKEDDEHTGLPYNWGGFDTIEQFDKKIRKGEVAGDSKIFGKTHEDFAGIDCSGFVSRVWGIKKKKGTGDFHNDKKSSLYPEIRWQDLKAGDIVNKRVKKKGKWKGHVRLFHKRTPDGLLWFYESTATRKLPYKGVVYRSIPRENYYIPRRYKKIEEGSTSPIASSTTTPVITKVHPNRLKPLPADKRQWITIHGKHFTRHSKLEFMVGGSVYRNRVPIYKSSRELRYNINVGPKESDWTVKVIDGRNSSKSYSFEVVAGSRTPGKYPETSNRYLKTYDLIGKSAWGLKIMKNEIFARHGYIFKTPKLRNYFRRQVWYEPKFRNVDSKLTEIERSNIKFIQQRETSVATPSPRLGDKSGKYPILAVAWLLEISYLNAVDRLNSQKVRKALKAFQKDSGLPQTGKLDDQTWENLSLIKLTRKTKAQIQPLISKKWRHSPAIKSCDPDLLWVAALLADMVYFSGKLEQVDITNVKAPVKSFQRDIGVLQTGQLDNKTWERLSTIRLSTKRKNQIRTLRCQ